MPNANVTEPTPKTETDGEDAPSDEQSERDDAHLDDVEVGAGCTEIWEHLADKREQAAEE